jgi:beta-galactosidase/beta-glucuronidase
MKGKNTMAFTKIKSTQKEFLEHYLRGTGESLSGRQADALYGIKNIRARMTEFRQAGLRVRKYKNAEGRAQYLVSARDVNGERKQIFA